MMKRVVCIGSAIVDVMVKSKDFRVMKSHEVQGGVAMCEVYGGKTEVDQIKVAIGGAGTNVPVGLARLGLVSAAVVRIGDDVFGRQIMDSLQTEGVETSMVQTEMGGKTGMSVILVSSDGGRSILTARGVSSQVASNEIDWEKMEKADWIQISSMGGNLELMENVVGWAEVKKIPVGVNPGKRELIDKGRLMRMLPRVKMVVLNKMEATSLVGHELDNDKEAGRRLRELGVEIMVITDGKSGAGVASADGWLKADAFRVKSLDDTGAGDAFCSGMVAGILKEWELERSLKLGLANGASEVMKLGVKDGLLYEREVDKWMKKSIKMVEEKW